MKKHMKKLIIAAALLVCADNGFAQIGIGIGTGGFGFGMNFPIHRNNSQRSKNIDKQVQQLKEDLDLNDEQEVKVRNLLIDRQRSYDRNGRDAMTREQFDSRMEEILIAEQYSKYNELKQEKRESKRETKKEIREEEDKEDKKKSVPPSEWDDIYQ